MEDIETLSQDASDLEQKMEDLNKTLSDTDVTYAQLKDTLKTLKTEWANANSEAARNTLASGIGAVQAKMGVLNESLKSTSTNAKVAEGSYRALQEELRRLTNAAKDTASETERIDLSKKANEINEQLKEMDAQMGNFQRNVGNYAGGISEALSGLGMNLAGNVAKGFGSVSEAGNKFKGVLTALASNPFIATVSILVGIFIKLKDAIGKNAETSKKWSTAMAAFKPILDAITNAIDWLATKMVDLFLYISKALPGVIKKVGSGVKSVLGFIGTIVDGITFLPKVMVKVEKAIADTILKGLKWIADKVDPILKKLGMSLSLGSLVAKGTEAFDKFADAAIKGLEGAGNAVRGWGDSVEKTLGKVADSMDLSMKRQEEKNKLVEDEMKLDEESAKNQLEYQKKLDEAQKASGKERKKLLEEAKEIAKKDSEARISLIKRQIEAQKTEMALTPTSLADKRKLADLNVQLTNAQESYYSQTKRLTGQIENLSKAENKNTSTKNENRKTIQDTIDKYKELGKNLESIRKKEKEDISEKGSSKEMEKSLGRWTNEDEEKYLNEKWEIQNKSYEDQKALLKKFIDDEKTSEQDRVNASIDYENLMKEQTKASGQHLIDINNATQKKITDDLKEAKDEQARLYNGSIREIENEYNAGMKELLSQYEAGNISYEELDKGRIELEKTKNDKIKEEDEKANGERIKALQDYLKAVTDFYGEGSQQYLDANQLLQDELTRQDQKGVEDRLKEADREFKSKQEKQQKQMKVASAAAKAFTGLADSIGKAWEDSIKARLDAGEISQEQAEEEFDRVKALQIASATVNTIEGAITAYTTAQSLGPIAGPIIGAINAAAVTATGIAQIAQIKRQTIGSSSLEGSSGPSIVTGSATPILNEARDIQGIQSISVIPDSQQQQDTRVYILQSDIEKSNNQVKVRQQNTTF